MRIEDNLTLLSTILQRGETILIPSDGVWGLSCDARKKDAISKLHAQIYDAESCCEEIIVSDIPMLKKYAPSIHPRIETLLYYHDRPIRVKCKQNLIEHADIYMRIAKDKVTRILLRELDFPLYFVSFLQPDMHHHLQKEQIAIRDLSEIKFVANGVSEYEENYPLLRIEYDDEGLIKVLS